MYRSHAIRSCYRFHCIIMMLIWMTFVLFVDKNILQAVISWKALVKLYDLNVRIWLPPWKDERAWWGIFFFFLLSYSTCFRQRLDQTCFERWSALSWCDCIFKCSQLDFITLSNGDTRDLVSGLKHDCIDISPLFSLNSNVIRNGLNSLLVLLFR